MNPKELNGHLTFPTTLLGIFAHEDDELVGTGGTLTKNAALGGTSVVICFGGVDKVRAQEFKNSCKELGVKGILLNKKEGTYAQGAAKTITNLKKTIQKIKPSHIITHGAEHDYHPDHRDVMRIARSAAIAAHPPKNGWMVKGILYTEGHFLHSTFHVGVDISDYREQVIKAFNRHKTQLVKNDGYYIKTLKARTELRGIQLGCQYGEVFKFEPLPLVGSFNRRNMGV